jgi:hypothetical protein
MSSQHSFFTQFQIQIDSTTGFVKMISLANDHESVAPRRRNPEL